MYFSNLSIKPKSSFTNKTPIISAIKQITIAKDNNINAEKTKGVNIVLINNLIYRIALTYFES